MDLLNSLMDLRGLPVDLLNSLMDLRGLPKDSFPFLILDFPNFLLSCFVKIPYYRFRCQLRSAPKSEPDMHKNK